MAWAATLAGIAFGNAGVHLPHAMSYAVAGLVRDFRMPGYPQDEPIVPHGISVVVNAPSVFRATAATCPARHLAAAGGSAPTCAARGERRRGEVLAAHARRDDARGRRAARRRRPSATARRDVDALAARRHRRRSASSTTRPAASTRGLEALFRGALGYW